MSGWREWLRARQHAAPLRLGLDLAQDLHALAGRFAARGDLPACAGGRPARRVPLPPPRPFTRSEAREIARVLATQNSSAFDGGAVRRFEAELARAFEVRHALALSSGTAALHTALIAAGIGPGDEVLVPALGYVSTALVVLQQHARVRFVDVDPHSFNLDPLALERALGPRTRAVIAVHLAGTPCDMGPILEIARARSLVVIEDAAQAHGARWRGRSVGTLGDLGCFSFQSAKTLSTGEGGALLTDDPELAHRARLAMNLGERAPDGRPALDARGVGTGTAFEYELLGWNYRMSALQAAAGLGQLARRERIFAARRRNAARLAAELGRAGQFEPQRAPAQSEPCAAAFFARLNPRLAARRAELVLALALERIDHRLPYDRPLSAHPIFEAAGDFPVARAICADALGLRVDPALGRRDLDSIVLALCRNLAHFDQPVVEASARAASSSSARKE